jgi:hypothetical protein
MALFKNVIFGRQLYKSIKQVKVTCVMIEVEME